MPLILPVELERIVGDSAATTAGFCCDRIVVEGDAESPGSLLKFGRAQVLLVHQVDDAVHAVAEPLDEAHVGEHLHDHRIAREALVLDVVNRDGTGQPAGAGDFHAVAENEQANAVPGDAVIAVGGGVDDQFARGFERVLEGLGALHRLARC